MTNRFSRPLSQNVPILPFVPEGYFHTDSRILGYFFPSAFEKCGANSFCHLWFLMRNSLSFELVHLIVKVQFLLCCFKIFFFVFNFKKWTKSWCRFLSVYFIGNFLTFTLCGYVFCQIWGIFNHYWNYFPGLLTFIPPLVLVCHEC